MVRHEGLIILAVMCCFAIMPFYSPKAHAGGIPEVLKQLDQIQKTLNEEVIPKLNQCTQCPENKIGVPKTGQKTSYGVGDDGALQKGIPLPVPRFTDNGKGAVSDNLTGLIWLKNANCYGYMTWANALNACNNLQNGSCGLTDSSVIGDWRLPNLKELGSLIDLGQYGPALSPGYPFVNGDWGPGDHYWSSTTYLPHTDQAWYIEVYNGVTDAYSKSNIDLVWCVRDAK